MKENSLQETVGRIYRKVPVNVKLGICATFIIGLLTNLFVFTNKCINHDDLMAEFIYNSDFDITSGRWTWLILRRISTYYDMPLVKGILGMALLAVSAGLIVSMFNVKDKIFVILISAILATYPINACYFSYMSISEIYYFAILFAVLGVFLVDKHKWLGPIAAALCICLSLGTYQSFLCLTIGLVFIMAFVQLFDNEFKFKAWFLKYTRYALTAGLGYVFYYIFTKIILKVTGNTLRGYAGTDQMFKFDFASFKESINITYQLQKDFYFTTQTFQHRLFVYVNKAIIIVFIALLLWKIISDIRSKKIVHAVTMVVMTIITPVFLNFIYIMMNGKSSAHILMKYTTLLPYIMMIAIVCHSDIVDIIKKIKVKYIMQWIVALCTLIVIYYSAITTNQLYLRMYYNANAIDSMATGLVTKISMTEDWTTQEPIFFANFNTFFNSNYVSLAPDSSELPAYTWMGTDLYPWYSSNHMIRYISLYHHLYLVASNNATIQDKVLASEEFKEMPIYPNEGSIKRIDGLLVVKFADN